MERTETIVGLWFDYWTKYEPHKSWLPKVLYGLQCLKDTSAQLRRSDGTYLEVSTVISFAVFFPKVERN